MGVTARAAVAIFAVAYALIATDKVPVTPAPRPNPQAPSAVVTGRDPLGWTVLMSLAFFPAPHHASTV